MTHDKASERDRLAEECEERAWRHEPYTTTTIAGAFIEGWNARDSELQRLTDECERLRGALEKIRSAPMNWARGGVVKWLCVIGFHKLVTLGFVEGDITHGVFRCARCKCGFQMKEGKPWTIRYMPPEQMNEFMHEHRGEQ